MNFIPDQTKLQLWDTWVYVAENGDVHLFYLANRPGGAWGYVGHAVSRDWLHWTDLPEIRIRGEEGTWDAGGCGTGMVFRHDDGRYYMSYTGGLSVEEATGLLTSTDLVHWQKLTPEKPLWPRVRQAPYEDDARRVAQSPAWRDAFVTRNPHGEWEAVCSARADDGPAAGRACLARCRVPALDHWLTLEPLAHVGKYSSMEVPEIFPFAGKYWVIFSTGSGWGVGLDTDDRTAVTGTFYVVSDHWEGPYRVPRNNLLIGAGRNQMHSYVGRTIPYGSDRLVYHHYASNPTAFGLPKVLVAEDGGLRLAPWDGVRKLRTRELHPGGWRTYPFGAVAPGEWKPDGDGVSGKCSYGADVFIADVDAPDVDLEAEVTLQEGRRAGLAVGMKPDRESAGYACLLDAERDEITIGRLERWPHGNGPRLDNLIDVVRRPVKHGRAYRMRMLRRNRFLELFVDDRLVFSSILPEPQGGGAVACVLESASAAFRLAGAHALESLSRG